VELKERQTELMRARMHEEQLSADNAHLFAS
jgi:hypothetical protein